MANLTPQERIDAYLASPSLEAWKAIHSLIIPGSTGMMGRTMWQAWVAIDGSAPTGLPSGSYFTSFPDAFTMRRGIRAAREGKVAVGLQNLKAQHKPAPRVPR